MTLYQIDTTSSEQDEKIRLKSALENCTRKEAIVRIIDEYNIKPLDDGNNKKLTEATKKASSSN